MEFKISDKNETILRLARKIGYIPQDAIGNNGEYNLTRNLDRNRYPRFHIYLKRDEENHWLVFNLHLDQKQPSYGGSHAHSGEYDGDVVQNEAERIKSIMK